MLRDTLKDQIFLLEIFFSINNLWYKQQNDFSEKNTTVLQTLSVSTAVTQEDFQVSVANIKRKATQLIPWLSATVSTPMSVILHA